MSEQFVLRIVDQSLADHLRRCLREEEALTKELELRFKGNHDLFVHKVGLHLSCQWSHREFPDVIHHR